MNVSFRIHVSRFYCRRFLRHLLPLPDNRIISEGSLCDLNQNVLHSMNTKTTNIQYSGDLVIFPQLNSGLVLK